MANVVNGLLIKIANFPVFFCIFAKSWRIVSKSGAFSSQAEITFPSVNKATAGVVTNHSFVSARRPGVRLAAGSVSNCQPFKVAAIKRAIANIFTAISDAFFIFSL